jgi:hypothetical protein
MLSLAARRVTAVVAAAFVSSIALAQDPTLPAEIPAAPVQVEQKPVMKHTATGGKKIARKSSKKVSHKKTKKHHKHAAKTTAR